MGCCSSKQSVAAARPPSVLAEKQFTLNAAHPVTLQNNTPSKPDSGEDARSPTENSPSQEPKKTARQLQKEAELREADTKLAALERRLALAKSSSSPAAKLLQKGTVSSIVALSTETIACATGGPAASAMYLSTWTCKKGVALESWTRGEEDMNFWVR